MIKVYDDEDLVLEFHEYKHVKRAFAKLNYILACCDSDEEVIEKLISSKELERCNVSVDGSDNWERIPYPWEEKDTKIDFFGENGELQYVYIKNCEITCFDIEEHSGYITMFDSISELPSREEYKKAVHELIEDGIEV